MDTTAPTPRRESKTKSKKDTGEEWAGLKFYDIATKGPHPPIILAGLALFSSPCLRLVCTCHCPPVGATFQAMDELGLSQEVSFCHACFSHKQWL